MRQGEFDKVTYVFKFNMSIYISLNKTKLNHWKNRKKIFEKEEKKCSRISYT